MKDHIDEEIERIIDDAPLGADEAYERMMAALADPNSDVGAIHLASGEDAARLMEMLTGEPIPEDMRRFFAAPPTQKEEDV